jgi:hypothetical protein
MQIELSKFSGEVVATGHVEKVSGLTANGSGSTWTDSHREIWIRPWLGLERRFIFINVDVPVRKGHRVALLLWDRQPLAVINFSTEQYVNLVSPRQFELFGAAEAFGFAALLVAAGLIGPVVLVTLFTSAGAYGLAKWLLRRGRYRETAAVIETEIRRIISAYPSAPVIFDHSPSAAP